MRPSSSTSERRFFVQSLERGLSVVRALDAPGPGRTLSEVAAGTGLPRAAARRFLLTLEQLGYVRSGDRRFSLTPRVLELGYAYLSSLSLPEVAQPHLRELVGRVHESCSMSVLDGADVVYVAREPTRRIMTVSISIGARFPAYATSMGRVLLAELAAAELHERLDGAELAPLTKRTLTDRGMLERELARVRRQGWALVDQELEHGLRSVAAPVRDADARALAAVNVSTHASRTTLEALRAQLLPELLGTVAAIERDVAAGGPASAPDASPSTREENHGPA
jgi:IclR family pca regulon transcriptional regulator